MSDEVSTQRETLYVLISGGVLPVSPLQYGGEKWPPPVAYRYARSYRVPLSFRDKGLWIEKIAPAGQSPAGAWNTDGCNLTAEVMVGTVEGLVEHFRQQLLLATGALEASSPPELQRVLQAKLRAQYPAAHHRVHCEHVRAAETPDTSPTASLPEPPADP